MDDGTTPRHLDGSPAVVDTPFLKVTFQHGSPFDDGINGCRVEDVVDMLADELLDFQSRALSCPENETALYHLSQAKEALEARRRRREQQGVYGSDATHSSD